MRAVAILGALALVCLAVVANAQAPNPPPIWPAAFQAKFGLYQFDIPSNSPIFNETSYFYYNIDITSQLINYPSRCVPIMPNGDLSPCQILFLESGIYWNQPALDIECCQLFSNVGPTPRNFTRGFTWNTTGVAPDYYGAYHHTDVYVSSDYTFKYWTELNTHHDVFFRDGAGAFWAWDHLNVTTPDPSVFNLFSDPTTCSQPCGSALGLQKAEEEAMLKAASNHGPIQLALHHHALEKKAHHHHHHQHQHKKHQHNRLKKRVH